MDRSYHEKMSQPSRILVEITPTDPQCTMWYLLQSHPILGAMKKHVTICYNEVTCLELYIYNVGAGRFRLWITHNAQKQRYRLQQITDPLVDYSFVNLRRKKYGDV